MKGIGMKMFSGYSVAAAMLAAATLAGCPAPELHTQELTGSNTLGGKELYFIPVEGSKRLGETDYARLVTDKETLTVPVTNAHTAVALDVVTALDEPVVYFGVLYYNIIVSNNGTVVLTNEGTAVAGKNANLTEHFQSRQVSVLPVDVTLQDDATDVTIFQDADTLVVTYSGVKVGDEVDNAFQVVFVTSRGLDGDVILSYGKVNTEGTTGVAGLSDAPLEGADQAEIDAFLANFGGGSALASASNNTPAS